MQEDMKFIYKLRRDIPIIFSDLFISLDISRQICYTKSIQLN